MYNLLIDFIFLILPSLVQAKIKSEHESDGVKSD